LSQISLTMFYQPFVRPEANQTHLLKVSRMLVIFWGVVLAIMAWLFSASELDLITLAFSMTTYTWGPMLGLFLLSMVAVRFRVANIAASVTFSIIVVLLINEPEIMNPLFGTTYDTPLLAWPWLFPIGALICLFTAMRGRRTDVS
jgi:Na+/proline symporter